MLVVIKLVVDDNILCLSATRLMHASAYGAHNTVQQLLCKTLNLISSDQWPEQTSAELEIYRVYSSVNMSCKSTNLKKSSTDCLNSKSKKQ